MILQALHDLYERLLKETDKNVPSFGYSKQDFTFRIVIRLDGTLVGIEDIRHETVVNVGKGKQKRALRATPLIVPGRARDSEASLEPCLCWDDTRFLLGWHGNSPGNERNLRCFEAFREKHINLEPRINDPEFSALCRFLENWSAELATEQPVLVELKKGRGVFQISGNTWYIHQSKQFTAWFESQNPETDQSIKGQCLITGLEDQSIARIHPGVFGIPGVPYTGANLVSFNDSAYESYGKFGKESGQCRNSPVSELATHGYAAALNYILADKSRKFRIIDTTTVFWTKEPEIIESDFQFIVASAPAEDRVTRNRVQKVLESLALGALRRDSLGDASTPYYLLGLTLNQGRLSVRLWLTGTLGELAENLQKHHNDLRIVRQWENEPKVPTIFQLLSETARQTARDADGIPPLLAGALIRAILSGAKYPESLYTAVLRRVHMERSVNYLKAAVIKAVLVRNHQQSINAMLDNECEIPAYRLGRLFAVLEKIQEEGHREQTGRNCEKTIRETYFSTACSTPAAVFPRIQQLSTHHRRHLNPGRKVQFDKLIADINWQLNPQSGAPKSHNLEEQGLFILGYYHQRKSLFSKAEAESETVSTEA